MQTIYYNITIKCVFGINLPIVLYLTCLIICKKKKKKKKKNHPIPDKFFLKIVYPFHMKQNQLLKIFNDNSVKNVPSYNCRLYLTRCAFPRNYILYCIYQHGYVKHRVN